MSLYRKAFLQGVGKLFSLPRLSIPLVVTLGLTLGAVLSVISISSTLLYKPLEGVRNEASIQTYQYRFNMSETLSVSYWNMARLASFSKQFADVGEWAAITPVEQDIEINNILYPTTRFSASNNILSVLGSQLIAGDDVTIESPEKYVWISNTLWNFAYGGNKSALGKQIIIDNQNYVIAGVIEDVMDVNSNQPILNQQVWFITDLNSIAAQQDNVGNISNEIDFLIIKSPNNNATLPTIEQTNEWLINYVTGNVESENLQQFLDFLNSNKKELITSSYRSNMLGDTENLIIALFGAVIGLLIMATLNLLNIFIAHYQGRTSEFSIQISLGASLNKVRLMVFLENLPSFILASITGLLVTGWTIKSLPLIAGDAFPMIDAIAINGVTVATSIVIIILLNVLFSTLALVDIDKESIANNLNSSGKGLQAQTNHWLSRGLMIAQLSIASVLLTASIMISVQSFQAVYRDLGYDIGNSYNVSVGVADEEYIAQLREYEKYQNSEIKTLLADFSQMIESAVPSSQVIISDTGPLSGSLQVRAFRNEDNGQRVIHQMRSLSTEFFNAFNIEFLAGANLTQEQINNDERRIVIDENMAKTIFPELSYEEVIGKTINIGLGRRNNEQPASIVNGIVTNTISQAGGTDPLTMPAVYSHRINASRLLQFTVMMPSGEDLTADLLNDKVKAQFPRLTNLQVQSIDEIWQQQTLNQQVSLWIVVTVTLLTLLLAAIGVAGLTQMTTNQRKYELAVRMATGAKRMRLINFVLKDATLMLAAGLGLGFIISVISYEQLQLQLEMLPAFNWFAMIALDIGLVTIVLLSVFIPAWKVINSDPMQALREE